MCFNDSSHVMRITSRYIVISGLTKEISSETRRQQHPEPDIVHHIQSFVTESHTWWECSETFSKFLVCYNPAKELKIYAWCGSILVFRSQLCISDWVLETKKKKKFIATDNTVSIAGICLDGCAREMFETKKRHDRTKVKSCRTFDWSCC